MKKASTQLKNSHYFALFIICHVHVAGLGSRVNGEITFHVGNLGPNTTKEHIVTLFQQANNDKEEGKVNNCIIPQDHLNSSTNNDPSGRRYNANANNQDSGRFALLTMPATTQDEVNAAMNACKHVNGHELDDCGNILSVREVTTLYVGNLSPRTDENGLCDLFEEHGLVTGCIIPADHNNNDAGMKNGVTRNNNNNGRFALVTMPINDAQSAITHLHGMDVDGNVITVRDIQFMNGGRGLPGGGLAAAALAAGAVGAVAAFNAERNVDVTLHVSNMNPSTSRGDIEDLFSGYGTVQECIIPFDDDDGGGGGSNNNNSSMNRFALVTMPAEEAFHACNELNGYELDGYKLRVREARSYGRNGIGGMRNLMDDTVSDYDASYDCRRRRVAEETPPGALATLGAMGAFIGGMILFKPCRKDSEKDSQLAQRAYDGENNDDLDAGLDDIINNIDGAAGAHDRRNFVVDPPGAFHMGKHHYTGDGVRYFSPLCEQCIAARADADGVVALAVNGNEYDDLDLNDTNNDLSFDLEAATKFTDFNSNDLGRYHSSMHVRHCKSTTCAICIKEKGVFFVKSRKDEFVPSAEAAGGGVS